MDIFFGNVFDLPKPPQTVFAPYPKDEYEEVRNKYLEELSEVLRTQIEAFTIKSGDKKLIPRSCYVSCIEESGDVAVAMPQTKCGIVTYWELQPVPLESGQAVFTSGW